MNTLTEFLRKARLNHKALPDGIAILDFGKFRRLLESDIFAAIVKRKELSTDFFLCGEYVAALLSDIANHYQAESWFACDYFLDPRRSEDPVVIKTGADTCFLICSVFPGRGEIRCMRPGDYEQIGKGLYFQYYGETGREIGYHMSVHFAPMVEIARCCLTELRGEKRRDDSDG